MVPIWGLGDSLCIPEIKIFKMFLVIQNIFELETAEALVIQTYIAREVLEVLRLRLHLYPAEYAVHWQEGGDVLKQSILRFILCSNFLIYRVSRKQGNGRTLSLFKW